MGGASLRERAHARVEMALRRAHEGLIGGFIVAAGELVGEHMRAEPIDLRQPIEQPANGGVEGDAVIAEQPQRLAHRAIRARRGDEEVRLGRLRPWRPDIFHRGDRVFRRQCAEHQLAAARADRRQDAARLMRDEQKQRAFGRLLDELQKRVGAGAIEIVGAVDDGDAPAALPDA